VKFIDEANIAVSSGNGGSGCVSFRREKYIPRGGPDGGDGGRGGNVVFQCTSRTRTLYHFRFKKQFKAKDGLGGSSNQKTGKNGEDLIIEIPPGTIVHDLDAGHIIKDFEKDGESFIIARGGRGGQGNAKFKTSTNRTPRFAQPGEPGETLNIKLELKLIADAGIIGLPNAGKSTLISAISSAKPKIGNYPFTTLTPVLGVVKTGFGEPFVVADIPGLIEGAHNGAGLGIKFLKHIERTKILVHLIDASIIDPDMPLKDYQIINNELSGYSQKLAQKHQIVVLNKIDIPGAIDLAKEFCRALKTEDALCISAVSGDGIDQLLIKLIKLLESCHE
jgi:GTP-binding protein